MYITGDTITKIEMQVKEELLYDADEIADDIDDDLDLEDDDLKITNWIDENENQAKL